MDEYQQDIFYDIETLPILKRIELIIYAMSMSHKIWVDKIEWPSGQRKIVENINPYRWIEEYVKNDSIFRFIHRRGYENSPAWEYRLEIVIRENEDFLWINLKEDQIPFFIQKYKLTII